MITDNRRNMSERGRSGGEEYSEELGRILRDRVAAQVEVNEMERELNLLRSGSAPPVVDRSLGGRFGVGDVSEEDIRSDPKYAEYYYQHVNMNPRLPPPLQAKDDWRLPGRRSQGQGGNLGGQVIGDRRRANRAGGVGGASGSESLFSMQPSFDLGNEEHVGMNEWGADGLSNLPLIAQDDQGNPASSFAASRTFEGAESSELRASHSDRNMQRISSLKNISSSVSHTYSPAFGASLSQTATPDAQVLARVASPRLPAVGPTRLSSFDRRSINVSKSYSDVLDMTDSSALADAISSMSLSVDNMVDERRLPEPQLPEFGRNQHPSKQHPFINGPRTPTLNIGPSSPSQYPNIASHGYPASPLALGTPGIEGRAFGGSPSLGANSFASAAELRNFARLANRGPGNGLPTMDPTYLEYLASNGYSAAALTNLMANRGSLVSREREFLALEKAYFDALVQKSHYGLSTGTSLNLTHGAFGNTGFGLGYPYAANPMSPMFPDSPIGPGGYPSGLRNIPGGFGSPWPVDPSGNIGGNFASLLDEFKGNKARCFELAEIAGHVVEFSTDQYGSRFIQQKLETASTMEKDMVFHEIMPRALALMTDVFGNYVIQKFFEHGSPSQIRDLAEELMGHVLTLSLQMYGCRVIQKAIEVVELDQQTRMVLELDGYVMRCVRDQNGNHVIQKCIECIPEAAIQFVVDTFYEQAVALSTHPYGCRVIQRVLEHCRKPSTQSMIMDEIMQSVIMLAQDQYGNYVIQHVLEHGEPHERTAIIKHLVGKVVQMSQQKFASNVIEKCLCFGTPEERQVFVDEMIGNSEENDSLQVLMKDQFANYVVQKVLETCDDQQLESILNRIKVHLNALKKYTYGKHIVARVEKLVAAGESRRISIMSSSTSA